jgi:hypothetical protein
LTTSALLSKCMRKPKSVCSSASYSHDNDSSPSHLGDHGTSFSLSNAISRQMHLYAFLICCIAHAHLFSRRALGACPESLSEEFNPLGSPGFSGRFGVGSAWGGGPFPLWLRRRDSKGAGGGRRWEAGCPAADRNRGLRAVDYPLGDHLPRIRPSSGWNEPTACGGQ